MSDEHEALREVLRKAFPDHDPQPLLSELLRYGDEPYHNEVPRVRRAIVQLCAGDAARLPYHLGVALQDYRDVLAAASRAPPSTAEAAADIAAARAVLERWGRQ